jgi:hypothetical protein
MASTTFYGYRKHGEEKDIFHIIVERDSLPGLKMFNNRLTSAEEKAGELKLLKFMVDYHYKKRTLDQNALMWVLYTILAYIMNAGVSGAKAQEVTRTQLYEQDVDDYCPSFIIKIQREHIEYIKQEYRKCTVIKEEDNTIYMKVVITTSHFNTVQMAEWIDRLFNRISYYGVPVEKQAEIHRHWKDWRQFINDEGITLHNDVMTAEQYKNAVPICEATGSWLGNGGGSLAHIDARGMGGNPEEWKDTPSNWLHLCDNAHALFDNGRGRDEFLKRYPHLRNKVEAALKKPIAKDGEKVAQKELDIF